MTKAPEKEIISFRFSLDWRASVLAIVLLPILLSLGFWQLDRAEEKRQLQNLFEQRQAKGPVAIEKLSADKDLQYQPVSLVGDFINDKTLFLDNRIYQGRFGYEIISPFKLADSKQIVLVNRGWVAGDVSRRSLPNIPAVTGLQQFIGQVYVPQSDMLMLGEEQLSGWPRVMQSLDVESLRAEFNVALFPYSVRLTGNSIAKFQSNWVVVNLQPEKHTGYAVQWFAMSATLLLITLLANTNLWSLFKNRISH